MAKDELDEFSFDDDFEEDPKPAAKPAAKQQAQKTAKPAAEPEEDFSDDFDEEPVPEKKPAAKPAQKAKPAADPEPDPDVEEDEDLELDEDSEPEDEPEEESAPKQKARPAAKPAPKQTELDLDDDDEPAPKQKARPAAKPAAKQPAPRRSREEEPERPRRRAPEPEPSEDDGELPGVVMGGFGEATVSRDALPRLKFSTAKIERLCILVPDEIGLKVHYDEDLKYILCFGKECCDHLGLPNVKYVYPVLRYPTDDEGELIYEDSARVAAKTKLMTIAVGGEVRDKLLRIHARRKKQTDLGICAVDLQVVCTDNNFQKVDFSDIGKCYARSSFDKPVLHAFLAEYKEAKPRIPLGFGRKMTPEKLLRELGVESRSLGKGSGFSDDVELDDVFEQD